MNLFPTGAFRLYAGSSDGTVNQPATALASLAGLVDLSTGVLALTGTTWGGVVAGGASILSKLMTAVDTSWTSVPGLDYFSTAGISGEFGRFRGINGNQYVKDSPIPPIGSWATSPNDPNILTPWSLAGVTAVGVGDGVLRHITTVTAVRGRAIELLDRPPRFSAAQVDYVAAPAEFTSYTASAWAYSAF